jgi:hypothetical protein
MPLSAEENPAQYDAPCVAPCPGFIGIIFTPFSTGVAVSRDVKQQQIEVPLFYATAR